MTSALSHLVIARSKLHEILWLYLSLFPMLWILETLIEHSNLHFASHCWNIDFARVLWFKQHSLIQKQMNLFLRFVVVLVLTLLQDFIVIFWDEKITITLFLALCFDFLASFWDEQTAVYRFLVSSYKVWWSFHIDIP